MGIKNITTMTYISHWTWRVWCLTTFQCIFTPIQWWSPFLLLLTIESLLHFSVILYIISVFLRLLLLLNALSPRVLFPRRAKKRDPGVRVNSTGSLQSNKWYYCIIFLRWFECKYKVVELGWNEMYIKFTNPNLSIVIPLKT